MSNKYCAHCWPSKRRYHLGLKIDYQTKKITAPLAWAFQQSNFIGKCQNYLWKVILESLGLFKVFRFLDEPEEEKLHNRSLVFFKEAKKRGLNIKAVKFLGTYINEFQLIWQNKKYYYEGIPLTIWGRDAHLDNKYKVKKVLQKNNIPTPSGKIFSRPKKAIRFARENSYPLVIKPNAGSLSCHVICPVNSETELIKAIKIAKKYQPDFIVEKYIQGNLYRATVVGQKQVFVCKKEKANVVGDGISTIKKLIENKNNDEKRGETNQRNTTLHKIPIDNKLNQNLKAQGIDFSSILPANKKVYLLDKFTLSSGCDIINCAGKIHSDNKKLFQKIANLFNADLVGIDFLCPDIEKSYKEQETAVLETNSLPYIDMHQYPSHGQADKVAEIVWDIVLSKL